MKKERMTKGSKKMEIFFNELINNKKFLSEIDEYKKLDNLPFEKVTDLLIDERNNLIIKICLQYGLEYEEFKSLVGFLNSEETSIYSDGYFSGALDTCSISTNFDDDDMLKSEEELDHKTSYDNPIVNDIKKRIYNCAYPLSINIRSLASKNDVIDYIEAYWKLIANLLSWARKNNKTYIRQRKKISIPQLVWKNRNLKTKEIQELISNKFPDITLGYQEVTKIKSLEKRRNNKDLSVLK